MRLGRRQTFIKKHIIHSCITVILFKFDYSHELFIKKRRGKKIENLAGHILILVYSTSEAHNSKNYTHECGIALAYRAGASNYITLLFGREATRYSDSPSLHVD